MTHRNDHRARAAGFTLVEMLVVIVIIGILASLTTVAVTAALDKANQTAIKAELDQIAGAFEQYKNEYGSYPPNLDVSNLYGYQTPLPGTKKGNAINAAIARHVRKAFPRSRDTIGVIQNLALTPAEAIVFWLGGFSSDPEHPFTGLGGPTFSIDERTNGLMEFDLSRLGPRDAEGDLVPRTEPATYQDANGNDIDVLLLLYVYRPPKLEEPYIYFDTSRLQDPKSSSNDDAVDDTGELAYLPDYRGDRNRLANGVAQPLLQSRPPNGFSQYVNPKSFQVMAAGTDDEWEDDPDREADGGWDPEWEWGNSSKEPWGWPTFPDGPFLGARADNLVSFSTSNLEDSQP